MVALLSEVLAGLGRADALGSSVLVGMDRLERSVLGVHLHEEGAEPAAGSLVLIARTPLAELAKTVGELPHDVAAAAVKVAPEERLMAAEILSGVAIPIVAVVPQADWLDIAGLVDSLIAAAGAGEGLKDGLLENDLFAAATAMADIVGAPVLIENNQKQVVAFSDHAQETEVFRRQVILAGHLSSETLDHAGPLYRSVLATNEPVYFEAEPGRRGPRLGVAIRAGSVTKGTAWAAPKAPPEPWRVRAFKDAAAYVAVHLAWQGIDSDLHRRAEAGLIERLLGGGAQARSAADQLGLAGPDWCVLACAVTEAGAALDRVASLVAVHASAVGSRTATARIGDAVYIVLSGRLRGRAGGSISSDRVAERVSANLARIYRRPLVGAGPIVSSLRDLPRSRSEADATIRVLRQFPTAPIVAGIDRVRALDLLQRALTLEVNQEDLRRSPLGQLMQHDAEHGTQFAALLRDYFEAFGNMSLAARRSHSHVNTVRYRLGRIRDITGLNLDEPDERLGLMLQLRLMMPPDRRIESDEEAGQRKTR